MSAKLESLLRLMAVQASYTYERMAGIGVGHAATPLLRDVFAQRPARDRREAIARSADFFNSHPYLASVAVGAVVKAERDGVPGPVISRLRTALSGPLGALGDQLIWAGWVPTLIGIALIAAHAFGIWAIVALLVVHNILRVWITAWGLELGLREGLGVGAALQRSWLPLGAVEAQRAAALAVGVAVPIVVGRVLAAAPPAAIAVTVAAGLVGATLTILPATKTRVTGLRFGLALVALAVITAGVLR
ncbi:MAG TPA: PTS system mannose/fructose/sorbose family transporter subunit IID [Gemmatimonadales bacterium]|jgi:mannose/fructose/N-acetylgalactosamine-specific phosphotransferase system component IID